MIGIYIMLKKLIRCFQFNINMHIEDNEKYGYTFLIKYII